MAESPRLEYHIIASLLLFLLLSTICSAYYIKPTPNSACPVDPCFTLSEYAQQLPHNLTSNNTLLLLPGDHVLSVNFTVENVSSFEILSSTPEDSHATTIVCQGLVAFSFRNISHMTMFGLTINACGKGIVRQDMELYSPFHYDQGPNTAMYGVSVNSVLYTNIANCSFQDSAGTAVAVLNSSLDIRGSNHFTSNCRRCGNYSCLCFGGGIFANMSTLVFTGNNAFRANSATLGGGIFAQNSILNFSGSSTFGNNSAARHGGGIAAYNSTLNFNGSSTFENNSAVNLVEELMQHITIS